ncbi:MAG: hypothetical protein ACOYVF_02245, partial [Candidatus Zixiibacteriota bacterium]
GGCFLADKINNEEQKAQKRGRGADGTVKDWECKSDGMRLTLEGRFEGNFILRPVLFEGQQRFLFYRLNGN